MPSPTRALRCIALSLLLISVLSLSSVAQTSFSGTATAATSTHPGGQTYGNLDLSGGPQTFIDLHWGYLDHTECGVNGAPPCNFVSDPSLQYDAGYNQSGGAPGCLGVCTYPAVPRDTYEGEGPSGTNDVQLDGLGLPTLGTPVGIQTSVTHDNTSSTSTCALGYFATPFGPYNGIVNPALGQTVPTDAMFQTLDGRSTASAACTPNGGSVSYTFHHDYEKLGLVLPITPSSPTTYFTQPVCFNLNSGLPPFNYLPLVGVTTPQPGTLCFNQVLDESTTPTSASITVATAVLTDTDGSQLFVCKTHADVEGCGTPPPPPPMLTCQAQGTGEVGTPFDSFLQASAGTPPYSNYVLLTGMLPNGLSLNSSTGEISGTPTTAGTFDFTAQVKDSSGQTASTPASPACHITITQPILQVVKTPKNGTFAQGSQVSFTIVVSNSGTSTAKNVVLTDSLPTNGGLTWTSATATPQGTCTITSSVLGCNLGNISPGGAVTVVVSSPTTTPASACQYQPNPVALATADNAASAQDNGSLNCTPPPPQLNVVKTPKNGIFTMGSQVSYKIVVSNGGAGTATNVMLNDALPGNGGLVWQTANTTQGSCSIVSNNLSCSLGDIASGGTVTVTVSSTSTTPNSACQSQPNPAAIATSGTDTAQDSGSQSCTPPPPQLNVVKTPKGGSFNAGGQISYTIVVSNPASSGSASATGVTLTDQLPGNGGLVWNTATTSQGSCSISSNKLTCNLGTIAAGASVTVTVTSGTTTNAMCQSQPNPAAVATANGGLKAQDSGSQACATGFTTFTMGGWGAPPHGNNPGALLKANFGTVFPSGVSIGTGFTATWTSAAAVQAYLPAGSTGGAFTQTYTNPTSTSAGVLGGQLLAVTLAVNFSNAGVTKTGLGGLFIASGPFKGDTVNQVLAIANTAIGGGGLPSGISFSDLVTVLDNINSNFDGGTTNHGFLY